jgi:predicted amidohydrolase
MKVGVIQYFPVFGGVARNIAKTISLARAQHADLWVLPELFATGYQFKNADEAKFFSETPKGPTLTTMKAKAAEMDCWFCGGFVERDASKIFNSSFLVGPGGEMEIYRKTHLFDREKELFSSGDTGFVTRSVNGVLVGMMICFDWIFPESARTLACNGAQLILHPSNLVLPHCPDAMKVRALENRVFTITANRIGSEDRVPQESGLTYVGQSVIYGPDGQCLLRADDQTEVAAVVEINPDAALEKRITTRNDLLADRRPDFYYEKK